MFSRYAAGGLLAHIAGRQAIFAEPTAHLALFTTAPSNDSGAGAVEVSGGSYARVATSAGSWNAATAPPPLIANAAAITFPTATADWGTVVAAGLYDAATGGNLLFWDWLGNHAWEPCTISAASPAILDLPAHGYAAGETVVFSTVFGGTVPSFSQASLSGLLVVAAPVANDTFGVTNGGTAVDTSGTGNGMLRRVVPLTVPAGVFVNFRPSALVLMMGNSIPAALFARGAGFSGARGGIGAPAALAARSGAAGLARGGMSGTAALTGRSGAIGTGQASNAGGGAGFILGTGTSSTDALGTGTGSSDLLGVQ
jgi:hypothetical protein